MMVQYHMEDHNPKCDACMEVLEKIGDFLDLDKEVMKPTRTPAPIVQQKDEVEDYNPIIDHDEHCDVYIGGICTCQS